jgi:cell division protease FtsH
MRFLTGLLFILYSFRFAKGFKNYKRVSTIKMDYSGNNINGILKNYRFIHESSYNNLVDKIENHDISKIYFSTKLDTVVSEKKDYDTNTFEAYDITKINPYLVEKITDLSTKNKVETVFLQQVQLNDIQLMANNILFGIENVFIPFIFLTFIVNLIRNFRGVSSNPFSGGMPGMPGMPGNIDKDKFNVIKSNISLSSFAGSPEIMEECSEVVSYIKNSTLYESVGAEIPRGILLEGPPGTGKTLLAKAIASETDAGFIAVAASEFIELFVGMGASKIRSLFKRARENKPCIIFIDEIDSIGRQRGAGVNIGNDEREQTLNQLLAEMDGFADNDGILVMAATNRKDVLDSALLRPGRFDRIITVPFPDKESRKSILAVHSRNKFLEKNINTDLIAELTSGFSGAQLKNLMNEAAIFAARENRTVISEKNILESLDKVIVGLIKKTDTRSDEAKRRVAIHEVGHAFLASYFDEYFELKKVTIQSTYNGAGGYTIFNEFANVTESGLYTKDLLENRIVVAMGGKACEEIFYGKDKISVGAVQDLKQANSLAQSMIGSYGMGDELESFYNSGLDNSQNPFLGRTMSSGNSGFSEITKQLIDKESLRIVNNAYFRAKTILSENRDKVEALTTELLLQRTLFAKDVSKIILDVEE